MASWAPRKPFDFSRKELLTTNFQRLAFSFQVWGLGALSPSLTLVSAPTRCPMSLPFS